MGRHGLGPLDHRVGARASRQRLGELLNLVASVFDPLLDFLVLGVVRSNPPQEPVGNLVALQLGEIFRAGANRPISAVICRAPLGHRMIPIRVDARMIHGRNDVFVPIGLKLGDARFFENFLALCVVARQLPQQRTALAGQRRFNVALDRIVEESVHLIKLLLLERVVLVVVALGTADRQAEPNRADRVDAVDRFLETLFTSFDSGFAVLRAIAEQAGSDPLFDSCVRQEITGDLLDGELVERHVAVEGIDHPMTPAPGVGPQRVALIAVAVSVAGGIEPMHSPFLSVMR